jgi:hypothetical protein
MKPPLPSRFDSVVALLQRVDVTTTEDGPGRAIATAFDGGGMLYLVAFDHGRGAPRWVREGEISATRAG